MSTREVVAQRGHRMSPRPRVVRRGLRGMPRGRRRRSEARVGIEMVVVTKKRETSAIVSTRDGSGPGGASGKAASMAENKTFILRRAWQ